MTVAADCLGKTSTGAVVAYSPTPDDSALHRVVTVRGKEGWLCVEIVALVFLLSLQLCIVRGGSEIASVRGDVDDTPNITGTLSVMSTAWLGSDSAALGSLSWYLGRKLVLVVEGVEVRQGPMTVSDCALITQGITAPLNAVCVRFFRRLT